MKTIFRIFSFLMLLIFYQCKEVPNLDVLPTSPTENIVPNSTEYLLYQNKTKTLVSAHRGGSGLEHFPENAIETMDFLYNKGVTVFEIDVALTKDQHIILMHDNSLQRTTTGRQDVNQVDLTTVKNYNLVDDFGNETEFTIPTFIEVLKWAKNKEAYLMVDIKKSVKYEDLIREIRDQKMENQCVLVSYTTAQAKKLYQLAPEMMLSVSMRNQREFDEMMQSGIPTNRMIAFTGTRLSSSDLYDKIHQKNIMVILGTLGNLDQQAAARGNQMYQKHEALGVDIFATDRPLEVLETLSK